MSFDRLRPSANGNSFDDDEDTAMFPARMYWEVRFCKHAGCEGEMEWDGKDPQANQGFAHVCSDCGAVSYHGESYPRTVMKVDED